MACVVTVTVSRARDGRVRAPELEAALRDMGGGSARGAVDDVFFLQVPDDVPHEMLEQFANEFLAGDPTREATIRSGVDLPEARDRSVILVLRKAGVMDPVEGSVLHALADAGLDPEACAVRAAQRFTIEGFNTGRDQLEAIATGSLANLIVDDVHCYLPGEEQSLPNPFVESAPVPSGRVEVPLLALDDDALMRLSDEGGLSLVLEEMRTIQNHFRDLGREPTDVELESLAQTWSEHCCHKTLTGPIDYDGESITNLLKETIFGVTQELDKDFCLSVFRDNAGVIAINDDWAVTFKVETHNHPSALEPYGGAGTGVGGCIRDTLGTGLGAMPILSTDVFCFGPLDATADQLPRGSLHPRRLLQGVVSGVRDYGNRMGIPTGNGAIYFHPGYIGNPLVFVGSVGLIPTDCVEKETHAGDLIIAIGGRTGRDGIHGATFSSRELTEESESISAGAVQIGNPIEEKKVLDALMRARDERLYRCVTDCGAGGFSSAVGEMGEEVGASVELSGAPLKYAGLSPMEVWISEAQERMVLAVPPANKARLFEILREEEVEGCELGHFTGDKMLRLHQNGELIGELSMEFLHDGRPRIRRTATHPQPLKEVEIDLEGDKMDAALDKLLAHPIVASKEPVIRQYDHGVQSRTVLRPLTGTREQAPADGCVLDPLRNAEHSVVVGCGIQPLLGEVDPYQMGAQAVDEAVRNVISSGGSLERLALLDNFAWGDVHDPEILGACIECARGAADAARAYGAPFISGKDSLHNTYRAGGVSRSIPHTLLVSAISVVPDQVRAPSSDLKRNDSVLILVGPPVAGVAGSLLQMIYGGGGGTPTPFDGHLGSTVAKRVEDWIAQGIVRSCHDLSDGGLAVAAAEMALGGDGQGLRIDLDILDLEEEVADEVLLYGEGPHRFLIEVSPEQVRSILSVGDVSTCKIGEVTDDGTFIVSRRGNKLIERDVNVLRETWRAPLFDVWPDPV